MPAGEDLLVSFGDCLEAGTYSLHSAFHKAVNYMCEDRLLSLVTPEVGGGPANLVLKDISSARVAGIQIKAGYVVIGNLRVFLSREKMYCSTLSSDAVCTQQIVPNLDLFAKIVVENSPALSLAFLLDTRRASGFTSSFERKLVERVLGGWGYLQRMQVAEGISQIRYVNQAP